MKVRIRETYKEEYRRGYRINEIRNKVYRDGYMCGKLKVNQDLPWLKS